MEETKNQDDTMEINNEVEEEDSEDYEYGRSYELLNTEILQRLKKNDPAITSLRIPLDCGTTGEEYFFNSINWKKDGDCISNNTQLKRIEIFYQGNYNERSYILGEEGENLPTKQQLQDFFSCIYQNSSVNDIDINSFGINDVFGWGLVKKGLCGKHLIRLQIGYSAVGNSCRSLGEVLKHPKCKLKDLRLPCCELGDEGMKILCDGLVGNSTVKRLELGGNSGITPIGWRALLTVLQHPNCKLAQLELYDTEISDESAVMLSTALVGGTSRNLNLGSNYYISRRGWQRMLDQLSQSSIERLQLNDNNIDDNSLTALANIGTLKSLDLSSNRSITPTGWRSFFSSLQTRGSQLVKLVLSGTSICNEGVTTLGRLLSNMSSLKALGMDSNRSITPQGWQTFFTTLQDSTLNLVELSFKYNNINYGGLQVLVRLVSNMNSLRSLCLGSNRSVTPVAWQLLTDYLQRPSFVLKSFDLSDNNIDDDALIAFAGALEHNKTLKQVDLEGIYDDETDELVYLITEKGWGAVSTLLCNKTSILKTYTSNHTLKELGSHHDDMNLPDDLVSYLELNENKDKAEVARQKILQTHFTTEDLDSSKMQVLLDMALEVMPIAIEWIGKPTHDDWKGERVSGLSAMYNLTRRLPDLFDSNAQKRPRGAKRKRDL